MGDESELVQDLREQIETLEARLERAKELLAESRQQVRDLGAVPIHEQRAAEAEQQAPEPEVPKERYVAPLGDPCHQQLQWGARSGNEELASQAIELGAFLDVEDELGLTPLHLAAMGGHASIVVMLLREGANPGIKAANGKTAQKCAMGDAKNKKIWSTRRAR